MNQDAFNILPDTLRTFTSDAVADWLCKVGFRDYTAKFLEQNVNGKKLLDIREFQVKHFISNNKNKEREFWQLLQYIAQNKALPTRSVPLKPGMFRQKGRAPAGRPQMMPPSGSQIRQQRPYDPPPTQYPSQHHQFAQYDSFDECSDEEPTYEEDIDSYPNPSNKAQYRKSSGYTDWQNDRPALPPMVAPGAMPDRFNPPAPSTPQRRSPTTPNYTMLDPKRRQGNRPPPSPITPGNPGIRLPPPRQVLGHHDDGPAIEDPQDAYLTFEEPSTNQFSQPSWMPNQMLREQRPQLPTPVMSESAGPALLPRSPARSYHDHVIPKPQVTHDLPDRPPPPPPVTPHNTAPVHQPPWVTRRGSDKDSAGNSPVSSRGSSITETHRSHVPTRRTNNSTGSSSSSNDDIPPPMGVTDSFRPIKKPFGVPFTPHGSSFQGTAMPMFNTKPQALEEQPWYRATGRNAAQDEVTRKGEVGTFVVRPRESSSKPYALTLWANNKIYNFIIRKREDSEYAIGTEKSGEHTFTTVIKLIEYYHDVSLILAENEGDVKLTGPP